MPPTIRIEDAKPDPKWLMPDELWQIVQPLVGSPKPKGSNGRPVVDYRRTMDAIFYVLRTGCQWKALPRSLGSGSSAHAYFQLWVDQGVFEQLWSLCLEEYDVVQGIDWQWLAADGAMTKAPLARRR